MGLVPITIPRNHIKFTIRKAGRNLKKLRDNKEKESVRPGVLPQAMTSSDCLLSAIGRDIDVFCQLDLSIVKRAL